MRQQCMKTVLEIFNELLRDFGIIGFSQKLGERQLLVNCAMWLIAVETVSFERDSEQDR